MNKVIGATEIDESLEAEIAKNIHGLKCAGAALPHPANAEHEMSVDNLGILLRKVTKLSTHEVDNLIDQLHGLRKKLETDRDRIQSEIARHSELSQAAMQLTSIISDNVKKLPPSH